MSSERRGGDLENAVSRNARLERSTGACVLVRQFPPMANTSAGMAFVGKAPIDLLGVLKGGQMLAIECKEVQGRSLPLSRLRDDQRRLMAYLHELGADVRLIVDFTTLSEVYTVSWPLVAAFIATPTRESLSVEWCRAFGLLLPEVADPLRRVRFLDGAEHPQKADALVAVAKEERAHRNSRSIPQSSAEVLARMMADDAPAAGPQRLTPEQRRARTEAALTEGIQRQASKPPRTFNPNKKRTA